MTFRVLLAGRGELVMRLIRYYRERGIETCSVFSEPEQDAPWVEAADYAVYLNGATVQDTYLHAQRIISAAHDAGCDTVHPGYCFFAERPDFVAQANNANLRVIGSDRETLEKIGNRLKIWEEADKLGIPVIPAVRVPEGEDGLEQAAILGSLPIYVKALAGGAVLRVDRYQDVPSSVREVRRRAAFLTGRDDVILSAGVPEVRQIVTTVVREPGFRAYPLGHHDKSVQVRFRSWMEELGPDLVPEEQGRRMSLAAARLVEALGLDGVLRVRWAINEKGGWWLLGVSARLTTGYNLTERVFDVDLVDAQARLSEGQPLGWEGATSVPERHGVQLRILHVDPADGVTRPEGVLERLIVPEGAEVGVAEGQLCTPETEPLLASIVVTGPTRHAALVKAKAILDDIVVEGVDHNVEVLKRVVADPEFWRGRFDVHLVDRHLG